MFIVGIDIAKRSHVARIIDSEGRIVVKPFSFRNSCSGYNALLARMHKITNRKSELILAMEATSHYWLALYTRLCREGYRVVLLNPIQTHAVRELLNNGDAKTDEIDTLAIAETIRFGRYKPSRVPQDKLLALRELCRNRYYLVDMASDLKRKITALLDQVFPEFETQFSTIFGKAALAVLKQYPTAEKMGKGTAGEADAAAPDRQQRTLRRVEGPAAQGGRPQQLRHPRLRRGVLHSDPAASPAAPEFAGWRRNFRAADG